MKSKQNQPRIGMILEQRDMMYHQEVGEWLRKHPNATASEIDAMHRELARKWHV